MTRREARLLYVYLDLLCEARDADREYDRQIDTGTRPRGPMGRGPRLACHMAVDLLRTARFADSIDDLDARLDLFVAERERLTTEREVIPTEDGRVIRHLGLEGDDRIADIVTRVLG